VQYRVRLVMPLLSLRIVVMLYLLLSTALLLLSLLLLLDPIQFLDALLELRLALLDDFELGLRTPNITRDAGLFARKHLHARVRRAPYPEAESWRLFG